MQVRRIWLAVAVGVGGTWLASTFVSFGAHAGDPLLVLCLSALAVEVMIATAALALALLSRSTVRQSLGLAPSRLATGHVCLLVLGTLAASHALDGALELSGMARDSALFEVPRMLEDARGLRLLAALLAIGIAPGIAEELLCRGLIQRGLVRRIGPWRGIPAASAAFGLLHVEPVHAGFAAVLGLYLGIAAHWAESTRTAMACHMTNNLLVVVAAAAGGVSWTSPTSTLLAAAVAVACLVIVARRKTRPPQADPARPPDPRAAPSAGIPPGHAWSGGPGDLQRKPGSDDR